MNLHFFLISDGQKVWKIRFCHFWRAESMNLHFFVISDRQKAWIYTFSHFLWAESMNQYFSPFLMVRKYESTVYFSFLMDRKHESVLFAISYGPHFSDITQKCVCFYCFVQKMMENVLFKHNNSAWFSINYTLQSMRKYV